MKIIVAPEGAPICCCGSSQLPADTCKDCISGIESQSHPVATTFEGLQGCLSAYDGCYPHYITAPEPHNDRCTGGTTMDENGPCGTGLLGTQFDWSADGTIKLGIYRDGKLLAEWSGAATCEEIQQGADVSLASTGNGVSSGGNCVLKFGQECT